MCVILHGLRKRHVRRAEVEEAMRANGAGFWMAALRPDGTRDSIRTLDAAEALKFFDDRVGDEDAFVMHARIPSRGDKCLANVHGWEENGVVFAHNMTFTSLDGAMRDEKWDGTDSEFFFRRVFMPAYRALGAGAYSGGRLHEYLDRLCRIFVGYSNKMLFLMPDNAVLRYGEWVEEKDRVEGGEVAFHASNTSYRPVVRSWPAFGRADDYDRGSGHYFCRGFGAAPAAAEPAAAKPAAAEPADADPGEPGAFVAEVMGRGYAPRTGFKAFVLVNAIAARGEYGVPGGARDAGTALADMLEELDVQVFGSYGERREADLAEACSPVEFFKPGSARRSDCLAAYLRSWSDALEWRFGCTQWSATDLAEFEDSLDAALSALNVFVDFGAETPEAAVTMFVPSKTSRGRPAMARVKAADLFVPRDATYDQAMDAAEAVLAEARAADAAETKNERKSA